MAIINNKYDHFNYFTHLSTGAALAVGATVFLGGPIISTLAIGLTAGIHFWLVPKFKSKFGDALPPERNQELHEKMETGVTGDKFVDTYKNTFGMAKRMGFKDMPRMHFYQKKEEKKTLTSREFEDLPAEQREKIISENLEKAREAFNRPRSLKDELKSELSKMFMKYANAAAFSHEKDRVIYSEPLIEKLNQPEIDGVSAHELCHLKANHMGRSRVIGVMTGVAGLTTAFNYVAVIFSSFTNFGLFAASAVASGLIGQQYKKIKGYKDNVSDRQKAKQNKEVKAVSSLSNIAILGSLCLVTGAQPLLYAFALSIAVNQAGKLLRQSYSRQNEYQADRVAGAITEDPLSLASGLNKVLKYNLSFEKGMDQTKSQARSIFGKAFDAVNRLYATHPTVENRTRALQRQADEIASFKASPKMA